MRGEELPVNKYRIRRDGGLGGPSHFLTPAPDSLPTSRNLTIVRSFVRSIGRRGNGFLRRREDFEVVNREYDEELSEDQLDIMVQQVDKMGLLLETCRSAFGVVEAHLIEAHLLEPEL